MRFVYTSSHYGGIVAAGRRCCPHLAVLLVVQVPLISTLPEHVGRMCKIAEMLVAKITVAGFKPVQVTRILDVTEYSSVGCLTRPHSDSTILAITLFSVLIE